VVDGTVSLSNNTIAGNSALGGTGKGKKNNGPAAGGGLYIWWGSSPAVYLDAFTLAHTTGNTPDDISGSYTLI
jgi:hypothetical protein